LSLEGDGYEILERVHEPLSEADKSPEAVTDAVGRIVDRLRSAGSSVAGVGVGLCAQLTDSGRRVVNSPNLHWRDVPIADLLEARITDLPIRIDNDLNAILLGEQLCGAARGCRDVVALYPGTGIGGAVMVDGRVVHGAGGFAGEVGHVIFEGELPCGCGRTGCAETIAGGHYIQSRVAADRASGLLAGSSLPERGPIRPDEVDRAALAGDGYALELWGDVATELSRIAAVAVALLNPELILLGGGVLRRCPALMDLTDREIRRRSPGVSAEALRIELGQLDEDAGLVGSAALCRAAAL
jgi:glucokinase